MSKIAFLGMGAMGSRMAERLVEAGHELSIWSRSPKDYSQTKLHKTQISNTIKDAVQHAEFIFSMVRDDEASHAVWLDPTHGALQHMKSDAIGIECSTLSRIGINELVTAFNNKGRALIEAPLAGSRPQAEAGKLIFFAGGESSTLNDITPLLNELGGAVHHTGKLGTGTTIKLAVNALFGTQLAVFAELLGFIQQSDMELAKAVEIISSTPVCSPAASLAANAMVAKQYAPAFPIELVAKDFTMVSRSTETNNLYMPITESVQNVFSKGVNAGFGSHNITGIAQLYL